MTPAVIWCVCTRNLKTEEELTFYDKDTFNTWLKPEFVFVGHNILSFDIPCLQRLWGTGVLLEHCVDTLVLSYLYNPALEEGHSLEAWGNRLKFPKGEYNDWSKLTPEMVEYCRQDVRLTIKVYEALKKKMLKLGYSEKSCEIEHKIRIVIDEQQSNGFYFNKVGADDFRQHLRREQTRLSEEITKLFPPRRTKVAEYTFRTRKDGSPSASYETHRNKYSDIIHNGDKYECYELVPFNLGSPKQRVERLLEVGWEPDKFTKKGFPQVDEESLVRFAEKSGRPEVKAMAEWLVIQGRASMLDTWFNNLGEDSRIHGRIFTCGATSRRCTHISPNTANIPSGAKAKYGHECRSFWGVEPDKGLVLVGVDASGLENVGLLHYLPDKYREKAAAVLNQKKPNDVHSLNARKLTELLGREIDREWGAKTSYYATIYGAYPAKLASIVKGPTSDGELVQETLFNSVPGLRDVIDESRREWQSNAGRLRCIDGGFVICPTVSAALNYRIQPLGAVVMKLACILLHERAREEKLWFRQVGFIHDEMQMETKKEDGERLGQLAVSCIEEAARQLKFKVPLTGSYKIGLTWNDTH